MVRGLSEFHPGGTGQGGQGLLIVDVGWDPLTGILSQVEPGKVLDLDGLFKVLSITNLGNDQLITCHWLFIPFLFWIRIKIMILIMVWPWLTLIMVWPWRRG